MTRTETGRAFMDEIQGIAALGPAGLLAGGLVAVVMGWVVPRWAYNDIKQERDFWRQAYVDSSQLSKRLTTVATQVVERVS